MPLLLEIESDIGLAFGFGILIIGLIIFGLWVWSIVWTYRDAEQRGKDGALAAVVVALLS